MKLLLNLVITTLNLMVHLVDMRMRAKKKKKKKAISVPWIETLFGYPFYCWFCLKFFPSRVPEEVEVFIHKPETDKDKEQVKLERYFLTSAGLWLPEGRV